MKAYLTRWILALALVSGGNVANAMTPLERTLTVVTEAAFPPFNSMDARGHPVGFDIDLAREICHRLKARCQFRIVDWDGLIPSLLARKSDWIMSSMTITDIRQRRVLFSNPYYSNVCRFIGRKGTDVIPTPDGMAGKTVGVQRGTAPAMWLQTHLDQRTRLRFYDTFPELYADLSNGRLDFALTETEAVFQWLETAAGQDFDMKEPVILHNDVGMAFRRDDEKLVGNVNAALSQIMNDGTYETLNRKWFPYDLRTGKPFQ